MQRMSDMLTRWLDTSARRASGTGEGIRAEEEAGTTDREGREGREEEGVADRVETEAVGAAAAAQDEAACIGGKTSPQVTAEDGPGLPASTVHKTSQESDAIKPPVERRSSEAATSSKEGASDSDTAVVESITQDQSLSETGVSEPESCDVSKLPASSRMELDSDRSVLTEAGGRVLEPDRKSQLEAKATQEISVPSTSGACDVMAEVASSQDRVDTSPASPESEPLDKLEPVISLLYRPEGTSASTIRVGLEPSDEGVGGLLPSPSARTGDVTSHVTTEVHTNGKQVQVHVQGQGQPDPSGSDSDGNDSSSNKSRARASQPEGRDTSQSDSKELGQPVHEPPSQSNSEGIGQSDFRQCAQKEADGGQSSDNRHQSDSGIAHVLTVSAAPDSKTEMLPVEGTPKVVLPEGVATSTPSSPRSQKRGHPLLRSESGGATPKMSSESEMEVSGGDSDKDTKATDGKYDAAQPSSAEGNCDSSSVAADRDSEKGQPGTSGDTEQSDLPTTTEVQASPSGSEPQTEGDTATRELPQTASSPPPPPTSSVTRQRRVGYSGPPTGDFQLHGDTDDDEEADSDAELMRAHRRSRPSRWGPRR